MTFIHRDKDMEAYGCVRHTHETVAQMRECEESFLMMQMEPASCPVCDAYNCGGDGHGCRQFEWGTEQMQAEAQEELAEFEVWKEFNRQDQKQFEMSSRF